MRRDAWRTATVPVVVLAFLLGLVGVAVAGPSGYTATGGMVDRKLVTRFDTDGTFDGTYLFDVELWSGRTRVYQDWDVRTVTGSRSETVTRSLPATLNGTYTVKAGVFSADWSTKYLWSENSGTATVTPMAAPAPNSPTSPTRPTSPNSPPTPLTVTARAGASGDQFQTLFTANQPGSSASTSDLMFDVELWSGGRRAFQYYETARFTGAGTYSLTRTLPASLARGTYTAKAGVFSPDWAIKYLWSENTGSVTVAGPPPVPTFTPTASVSGNTFRTVFNASTTSSQAFLFDVELWDGGRRVYQSTETTPVTGSSVVVTRTLPAGLASGRFDAKASVWSAGWGMQYLWRDTGRVTVSTPGTAPLSVSASATLTGGLLQGVLTPSRPLSGQYLADIELWQGGNRVYQSYAPANLNGTSPVTLTRVLPASVARGSYTVRAGLFSPDWSTKYFYGDAGTLTVATPAAGPGAVAVTRSGQILTATFDAPSALPADAVLAVEIYDSRGLRVGQELQRRGAGGEGPATASVRIPAALGNGDYTVRAGAFSADLRTALRWDERAGAFTVTSPPPVAPDRAGPIGPNGPAGAAGPWRLAFGDEFEGDHLDQARWSTCSRQMFVTRNQCFGHNEEVQTYLPGNVSMTAGASTSDGDDPHGVRLTARADGSTWNFGHDSVTAGAPQWNSGMLSTGPAVAGVDPPGYTPFSFTYGFFEVRMRVPAGQGLWPAAWLFPADNAGPAEIDLAEVLGHDPATTYMSVHYPGGSSTEGRTGPDLSAGFHTFGVDWQPDRITWYVDGVVARSVYGAGGIPSKPMYPMINLAVGGSWPGSPDASTPTTASLDVDWVRIWQR